MSKRKVQFADEDPEEIKVESSIDRVKVHSLDSDDEDDDEEKSDEKYVLQEEDLEGQEDATIDYDGGIKITPFNLKEEMEEGHFDAEGNYFEKKEEVIRDEWLDSLDWVKVKERGDEALKNTWGGGDEGNFEDADEPGEEIKAIKDILEIIKPGETVLKALRRLGGTEGGRGKCSSASARWQGKAKKQKVSEENVESSTVEVDKERLLKLTELADFLLQRGNFGVYQDPFEKLAYKVKTMEEKQKETEQDDALEAAFNLGVGEGEDTKKEPNTTNGSPQAEETKDDEVYWQYKWENTKNATLYGPYSSTYMLNWNEQGCFGDGVWVRKVGEDDGPFYNSKRIDFELYT